MNIRKGMPEDMPDVLALIKELAIFEKEPNRSEKRRVGEECR